MTHSANYTMGGWSCLFPGSKAGGAKAIYTPPFSVEVENTGVIYFHSLICFRGMALNSLSPIKIYLFILKTRNLQHLTNGNFQYLKVVRLVGLLIFILFCSRLINCLIY